MGEDHPHIIREVDAGSSFLSTFTPLLFVNERERLRFFLSLYVYVRALFPLDPSIHESSHRRPGRIQEHIPSAWSPIRYKSLVYFIADSVQATNNDGY